MLRKVACVPRSSESVLGRHSLRYLRNLNKNPLKHSTTKIVEVKKFYLKSDYCSDDQHDKCGSPYCTCLCHDHSSKEFFIHHTKIYPLGESLEGTSHDVWDEKKKKKNDSP